MSVSLPVIGIVTFLALSMIIYQFAEKILDWIRFQSVGTRDYVVDRLKIMMIDKSAEQVFFWMASASFVVGALVFMICLPSFIPGFVLGVIAAVFTWFAPKWVVNYMYKKRVEAFVGQMVDGLSLMSNGIRSGLSVVQAIGLVSQEMPKPMKDEFQYMLNQNKLGLSVEESFTDLARRIQSEEVEMFVTAVNILKITGGNLAETFDTISFTIRERVKMEGKIKAMMSQALRQGMMLLAFPPIMLFMLKMNDPVMFNNLVSNFMGWVVLAIVVACELVAYVMIIKITKIDI